MLYLSELKYYFCDMSSEDKDIIIKPQEGFQESFVTANVDVCFGGGILAAGKAETLDSHIVTPFGLRRLRDIRVGDIISNPETGGQERVILLHPIEICPYYRVTFVDGTHVDCSEGHLWKVRVAGKKTKRHTKDGVRDDWRIWTAKMIYDFFEKKKSGRMAAWGLSIPLCEPISFTRPVTPTTPRPLPAYVLGALLGDGCVSNTSLSDARCVGFTSVDDYIAERFASYGVDMSHWGYKKGTKCKAYRIYDNKIKEAVKVLKIDGHTAKTKFIPQAYKFATIAERKELLQGLIDTDGHIDTKGHITYTTISKQLAEDVAFVVRSLGGLASISKKKTGYKDKDGVFHKCNLAYNVSISTRFNDEIVSLPHKKERTKPIGYSNGKKYYFEKSIEKIEFLGRKKGRCITVDNPSGLYATNDFTVTHNSFALVLAMAEPLMTDPDFRAMISRRSLGNQKAGGGFVEKFKQIFGADYIKVKESDSPRISFPNGTFCDLTYLDDSNMDKLRERAKGWEYDMIAIDELTEMSWEAFSYVITRNRGQSKTFTGKFFATMNPKRSHWIRIFIDWYIGIDGKIIPERDGKVRYFYVNGSSVKDVVWGDSKKEVYLKCKIDIDRKLAAIGGNFSYKDIIKSFVFYQGRLSENKGLLNGNAGYIGSIAASGGKMAQALVEGNWNVDPEEEEDLPISGINARRVFTNDPALTGEKWITIDLADYGTDNMLMIAWNGFHIVDIEIHPHSTPRQNAEFARQFAIKHDIAESHIIYDATAGRYFNDYIPDANPYMSSAKPIGIYYPTAMTLKDLCYLRLCRMINAGELTMEDAVAEKTYTHQNLKYKVTIQNEFLEECAVVRFEKMPNGKRKLMSKKEMNRNLGKGRSMDLLDPCAMRFLPCVNYEYGMEIQESLALVAVATAEYKEERHKNPFAQSIYDETLWG